MTAPQDKLEPEEFKKEFEELTKSYPFRLPDLPKPTKDDLSLSLKLGGRSAPGKDGLTGKAYREAGEVAEEVLGKR